MWQHCAISTYHLLCMCCLLLLQLFPKSKVHSVFMSTQGLWCWSLSQRSHHTARSVWLKGYCQQSQQTCPGEVERCLVQLAQDNSWSHWTWPWSYGTSTLGEVKRFTLLAMAGHRVTTGGQVREGTETWVFYPLLCQQYLLFTSTYPQGFSGDFFLWELESVDFYLILHSLTPFKVCRHCSSCFPFLSVLLNIPLNPCFSTFLPLFSWL